MCLCIYYAGQVINLMVDFYGAKIVHMEEEEEVLEVLVKVGVHACICILVAFTVYYLSLQLYIKLMEKMPRSFRRKRNNLANFLMSPLLQWNLET